MIAITLLVSLIFYISLGGLIRKTEGFVSENLVKIMYVFFSDSYKFFLTWRIFFQASFDSKFFLFEIYCSVCLNCLLIKKKKKKN